MVYFLFDLPWSEGRDFTGKTVLQRRKQLHEIITPLPWCASLPQLLAALLQDFLHLRRNRRPEFLLRFPT